MKAWRFHEHGPVDQMRLEDVPQPELRPGEALVRIEYAALNPADRFLVMGKYPRAAKPPFTVGRDGVGVVETGGERGLVSPGQRVVLLRSEVGVTRPGTLGQYVAVDEEALAPLPRGWSPAEAAAGPLVLLTAWQALVTEGEVGHGQTVLVTGASGGVGTAAVILAKALGARVVALSRSEEKRERLLELGADFVFDSDDPELVRRVQEALDGGRADVVVENLGGPFLQKAIHLTGFRGRVCVVGLLAGLKSELEIGTFLFKRIHIIGIAMGGQTPAQSREAWWRITELLERADKRPIVDSVFPFEQAPQAFGRLAEGPLGKVVIGPIT